MSRLTRSGVLTLCVLTLLPAVARAHESNPRFRSVVTGVSPPVKGLTVNVLEGDDRLQLINATGRSLVVSDEDGAPYLRIRADGAVEQNRNSKMTYDDDDAPSGRAVVPPGVRFGAAPVWTLIDRSGRHEWHDDRIHYAGTGRPSVVKDPSVRTKVFDWKVPIRVGSQVGTIAGTLTWVPKASSGAPVGAVVAFVVLAAAGALAVALTRRRRADAHRDLGADRAGRTS